MLDATTVVDLAHDHEEGDRSHEFDHRQSPHGDSASSITEPEEHDRGCGQDNHDLRGVILSRDAHSQIENRRRERERMEQEQCDERDCDYYGPYYDQPHGSAPLKEGII
jgi:hypothetical protein